MMLEMNDLIDHAQNGAVIKVIGVGGGGGNAVNYMAQHDVEGVEFICANTDSQALRHCAKEQPGHPGVKVIQLGVKATKGLGAGTNPEVGRVAALEEREKIEAALEGTDMVFITTGMGGGTGTGAAPVIAQIAKEMGILTVAVVTRPFPFEGKRRMKLADEGIRALSENVDSLITIPNEKLMTLLGKDAPLMAAFSKADDVLYGAVRGISDIIKRPGMVNVDFADVKAVMSEMGMALMGTGKATGSNRAREATEAAIHNPLLADVDLKGARGILVSITSGVDITLGEFTEVGNIVEQYGADDAIVKVGTVIDPSLKDELHVTVVATGLELTSAGLSQAPAVAAPVQERAPQHSMHTQQPAVHSAPSHRGAPVHVEYQQPVSRHSESNQHPHHGNDYHEPSYDTQAAAHFEARIAHREAPAASHVQMTQDDSRWNNRGQAQVRDSRPVMANNSFSKEHQEDLDIPAFLRRRRDQPS
jgi:cell division protein FtsZ